MLKGILLGVCASILIVSLIFIVGSGTGNLGENAITGSAISRQELVTGSFFSLIVSVLLIVIVVLWLSDGLKL